MKGCPARVLFYFHFVVLIAAANSVKSQSLKLSGPTIFQPHRLTVVGGVSGQFGHKDGVGTNALFGATTGLATDASGNLYVADGLLDGQTIRKMTPDGVVSTVAGQSGQTAEIDGKGSAARFYQPHAVVVAADGTLFVADSYGETIRKVTPEGFVSTLAGKALSEGSADGVGTNARFRYPTGITLDSEGNLYVSDQSNHTIRKVTPLGEVTTIAGKPLAKGTNDGFGADARFNSPRAITYNRDGNLYVADAGNSTIRQVTPTGQVTTMAGAPGQWSYQFIDGKGDAARFCWITGIAADSAGNLYVTDAYQRVVRRITLDGTVTTLADQYGVAIYFKFGADHSSIAVDPNDGIYVADAGDNTILREPRPPSYLAITEELITAHPFVGAEVVFEISPDLKNWQPLQTNFVSGYVPARIIDVNGLSSPSRFYRAWLR